MAKDNFEMPSLPEQQVGYARSGSVRDAMISAGSQGKSRVIAGVKQAFRQKMSSLYGDDGSTTKVSMALRLLGGSKGVKTAEWIDRFFAKESIEKQMDREESRKSAEKQKIKEAAFKGWQLQKKKGKNPPEWNEYWKQVWREYSRTKKAAGEKVEDDDEESVTTIVPDAGGATGGLRVEKKLDLIAGIVQMTAEDVTDIKSLLMPKLVTAAGKNGDEIVQYNPLAPQGQEFNRVTESGKLTAQKPSKEAQKSAERKAALETAKLALAIQEKDKAKVELRKKYQFKEEEEKYKEEDPNAEFRKHMDERLDKIEEKLSSKSGLWGLISGALFGLWSKFTKFLSPIWTIFKSIGKAIAGVANWGLHFGKFVIGHMWKAISAAWRAIQAIGIGISKLLGRWFPGLTIPGLVAGGAAVATTAAIGASIDKGMKQVNDKEILKITKDVTVAQERGGVDPEQSYVAYKMAIDKALESSHNASPERQDYIKQQLTQAEELSDTERRMAARYFYEKEGGKPTGPTSRGGKRNAITPKEDSIPAEVIAEGSDTVDTNYADVPVAAPTPPKISAVGDTGQLEAATHEARIKALGDVIASGESNGDYTIYNKGTIGRQAGKVGHADFSKMTIAEYLRRGKLSGDDPDKIFAMGKYQIIPDTMAAAAKTLNLNPETTTLGPETQEHIFREFLIKSKRPAIHNYLTGKSNDKDAALMAMAQEWASVGVPYDTVRKTKKGDVFIKKGQSYYAGEGGNKAHTSVESIASLLTPTPTLPGAVVDAQSRQKEAATYSTRTAALVAPTTVINSTVNQTVGKRPAAKADVLSQDKSLARSAGRDTQHPAYG